MLFACEFMVLIKRCSEAIKATGLFISSRVNAEGLTRINCFCLSQLDRIFIPIMSRD